MKRLLKEVYEELILVLKGRTLDTLIPPILFAIALGIFGLEIALIIAVSIALIILGFRAYKKEEIKYAFFGVIAVSIAALFSYLNQNPVTYFIPDIIGSGLSVVIAVFSLIIKKPMAAYLSHLTRGWPLDWFWRDDVRPAYKEVTYLWLLYFIFRTALETTIYLTGNVNQFVWVNTLLGFPLLISILTISYIYGIWRLRKLGGPGVDEYISGQEPPYKGQTRGF